MEFATYGDMKNVINKLDDTEINGRRIRIVEQKTRGRRHRFAVCHELIVTCQLCVCVFYIVKLISLECFAVVLCKINYFTLLEKAPTVPHLSACSFTTFCFSPSSAVRGKLKPAALLLSA